MLAFASVEDLARAAPGLPPPCGKWDLEQEPRATIDFETRSRVSIKKSGAWRYAEDPSTEVMCLAYHVPGMEDVGLWHPAYPHLGIEEAPYPQALIDWIVDGGLVEAHNAQFERAIWRRIMVERLGWPAVGHRQWRCSAAKAAYFALPRSLDGVGEALRLPVRKDRAGHQLMLKLSKPRKARKKEREEMLARGVDPESVVLWHESRELFERHWDYCRQDVRSEMAESSVLRDLPDAEVEMYLMDQEVNERGVHCDMEGVEAALRIVDAVCGDMNEELRRITGGRVERATKRAELLAWLQGRGVPIDDTTAETVESWLRREDLPREVLRAMEILRAVNRTSTKKLVSMTDVVCQDSRLRGLLLYHGANTGRWSGSLVQPHNFPRGRIPKGWMEYVWECILDGDLDWIEALFGDPMELLSHALRGAITASPGMDLYVADYAAIEARAVMWLAGDETALGVFRRGEDIYCDMATAIFGRPITKKDERERFVGKQAILGLGYGMGASKFQDTCLKYGQLLELEFCRKVVDTYRERYWRVRRMWNNLEAAAIAAVEAPGRTVKTGMVAFRVVGRFLHCRLPSGRTLSYPEPLVRERETPWGTRAPQLTFMAQNDKTRKWERAHTWGGTLVENVTQAVARDLMGEAMLRLEATGVYRALLSVHDEAIAEAPEGQGDVRQFERIMAENPPWAEGCPVVAEGWKGKRYRK